MTDYKIWLGGAAAIVGVIQYLPYTLDILRGKTRPHAFSWFVWGVPAGIVFLAQWLEGGAAGSWATGVTMVLCTVIFGLALFRGEKEITRLDWLCLLLALAAIGLWITAKDPLGSVVLVTAADTIACGPTLRKSIRKPQEETASAYVMGALKWSISLPALTAFSPTTALYPAAMAFNNGLILVFLLVRRRTLAQKLAKAARAQ